MAYSVYLRAADRAGRFIHPPSYPGIGKFQQGRENRVSTERNRACAKRPVLYRDWPDGGVYCHQLYAELRTDICHQNTASACFGGVQRHTGSRDYPDGSNARYGPVGGENWPSAADVGIAYSAVADRVSGILADAATHFGDVLVVADKLAGTTEIGVFLHRAVDDG